MTPGACSHNELEDVASKPFQRVSSRVDIIIRRLRFIGFEILGFIIYSVGQDNSLEVGDR